MIRDGFKIREYNLWKVHNEFRYKKSSEVRIERKGRAWCDGIQVWNSQVWDVSLNKKASDAYMMYLLKGGNYLESLKS